MGILPAATPDGSVPSGAVSLDARARATVRATAPVLTLELTNKGDLTMYRHQTLLRHMPRRPSMAQLRDYFDELASFERNRDHANAERERNERNAAVLATLHAERAQ